ncbi:MAG TPA: PAS domain S-box protein [Bryobacteraceae bacterium]|nr:PAS domain S-box protein [Bryobacteraceae bacterium]
MEQSVSLSALPEYERRFRSAFEHAAIGMAIVDRSGAYVFVNQAFCRISGYQDHELYGMTFTATLHPEEGAMRLDVFQKILAGELGSRVNERRFIRKNGGVAWVRMSLAVPGDEIRPTHFITLVEDITERKEIEEARRASEERFRIAAENASDLINESDHPCLGDWPVPLSLEAWKNIIHPQDVERVLPL